MNDLVSVQQTQPVSLPEFILNLLLVALFSILLGKLYVRYGTSLSNRRLFAKNFLMLAMITMLVISIVKSSLALSLGLVGALSIVRFRSAIKEPEELAFLFFAIALGLGFGANQGLITSAAFGLICLAIIFNNRRAKTDENKNLFLTVSVRNSSKVDLDKITQVLKQCCSGMDIRRFDSGRDHFEVSFLVEFDNYEQLRSAQASLQGLDPSVEITFIDQKNFNV